MRYDLHSLARSTPVSNIFSWFQSVRAIEVLLYYVLNCILFIYFSYFVSLRHYGIYLFILDGLNAILVHKYLVCLLLVNVLCRSNSFIILETSEKDLLLLLSCN